MSKKELIDEARTALESFNIEKTVEYVKKALQAGVEPLEIINEGLSKGLLKLGELFEKREIYLPELIVAAEAMKEAMKLLRPMLEARNQEIPRIGRVLIGTIEGDIHDIGKNIVASVLQAAGFEIIDLGKDVPVEVFVKKVRELAPDIVGVSALLSTTALKQGELIKRLEQEGLKEHVIIMIGGAPTSREWQQEIGADGYAADALGAVEEAKQLIKR
ncbi:MAG: corrinoid protein [Candidatus Heimdallarchaeota archaeon]